MTNDMKPFYTLEEVKKYLLETNDSSFKRDKSIISLIHTNRLTPYVRYKGLVDIVTDAEKMSEEARKEVVNSLSHNIATEMSNLEIGELVNPHDYDSTSNLNDIIYLVKKLLFSLEGKRAKKTLGVQVYVEGIFRLSSINIAYSELAFEVILGTNMFIAQAVQFDLNDPGLNENEIEGYILYPDNSDENDKIDLEYNCELVFARHDLLYILKVIKNSHELPKLENDLSDANRTIARQDKEIRNLKKELEKIRSEKPKNDVKDSVYALILVFKDLLLNPDINASNFKSDSPKSTGEPTQSGLIEHIISKNIPKLGKRNIEEILRLANQL
ncbi:MULTISPECIES: hypothetical protein [unclassified Psychrobacter]|uniref:hypothetical protein n=1 Tax=unclassified Psychrobacter TaxID=196806 RepID=UPI00086D82FF|nr:MULTISPECIES: hypothetical protein [unclassified Psychrobacter]OEH66870.1 MAG: hypothetical protein BAX61_07695 [Psychrobacter sp. B29-1]PKG67992.1 hypothetical protein CXF56_00615 [Psychrobacter sp. Choline-02u-13]PKH55060.1 hypothetical protein CXF69_00890 [Psychrobacter sp. Choline-02u-9]|tara:strand:- start:30380 stop:31363 length:984 start_codon:yes stop_codon:yes gene_type:complete